MWWLCPLQLQISKTGLSTLLVTSQEQNNVINASKSHKYKQAFRLLCSVKCLCNYWSKEGICGSCFFRTLLDFSRAFTCCTVEKMATLILVFLSFVAVVQKCLLGWFPSCSSYTTSSLTFTDCSTRCEKQASSHGNGGRQKGGQENLECSPGTSSWIVLYIHYYNKQIHFSIIYFKPEFQPLCFEHRG